MAPPRTHACDRCGRTLAAEARCPQHPGARLLDLRNPDNAEWQAELLLLRRDRWRRLASFATVGGLALAGLVLLTLFLFDGLGAREASTELALVTLVVSCLHLLLVAAQAGAVGLAIVNLSRWVRNTWERRQGGTRRDPLAWRKAPYVAGTLVYAVLLGTGLGTGTIDLGQPLQHVLLAGAVALGMTGLMLLIDVVELAARLVQREAAAPLPDRSWDAWLAAEARRMEHQRS
jgi:hypothetical protein